MLTEPHIHFFISSYKSDEEKSHRRHHCQVSGQAADIVKVHLMDGRIVAENLRGKHCFMCKEALPAYALHGKSRHNGRWPFLSSVSRSGVLKERQCRNFPCNVWNATKARPPPSYREEDGRWHVARRIALRTWHTIGRVMARVPWKAWNDGELHSVEAFSTASKHLSMYQRWSIKMGTLPSLEQTRMPRLNIFACASAGWTWTAMCPLRFIKTSCFLPRPLSRCFCLLQRQEAESTYVLTWDQVPGYAAHRIATKGSTPDWIRQRPERNCLMIIMGRPTRPRMSTSSTSAQEAEIISFLVLHSFFFYFLFPAPTCAGFTGCAAISQNLVSNAGSVTCPQVPCTTQNCCTRMRWCASPVFFYFSSAFLSDRWCVVAGI